MRIEANLDEKFPQVEQNAVVKNDVLDILVWREMRLKEFVDFAIILEEMGVEVFLNYDFKMKKSAQVRSPTELMSDELVRSLVYKKLRLVE